jgi:protein SCO1/2
MHAGRKVFFYGLPLILGCLIVGQLIYQKVQHSNAFTKPLEKLGTLPEFQLTNQYGETFSSKQLLGKVNVINFMFTTCQGLCPTLNKEMQSLAQHFSRVETFSLLSISVDPENDTPAQLQSWAVDNKIDQQKWNLVTGARSDIKTLLTDGLKVGLPDQPQAHSDRFVLLDKQNVIRGYYRLSDPDTLNRLRIDIFSLCRG